MSQVSRKVAVDFLFGETKKPHTHRQCTIHMHDRTPGRVGWLVGWLVGRLVGWLVGWLKNGS